MSGGVPAIECVVTVDDLTQLLEPGELAELERLCCFTLETEAQSGNWMVSIVLTTDEHMSQLHDAFMGIATTTDILTFPFGDEPGGDIAISVAQADRQRSADDWTLLDELQFLTIHGVLHLVGWDDLAPASRAAMLARQRAIMRAFQAGPASTR